MPDAPEPPGGRAPPAPPLPYRAPRWLPDAHSQTIWPAVVSPRPPLHYHRERWDAPDGDFVDVDFTEAPGAGDTLDTRPLLVLFHGLEGSARSHYALALMRAAMARGWRGAVPHFRGCSGEPNRLPRAYHSGDSAEIDWLLRRFRSRHAPAAPLLAVGVSLGGNALLKWAGEHEAAAGAIVAGVAAVCPPQDLEAGAVALSRGFNRVYTANFMKTLKTKSLAKLARFPGLYDRDAVAAARSFHDFDGLVTAPLHGFADCYDYWQRSSCRQFLPRIRVPTLVINTRNDPFVPFHALASADEVSSDVLLDYPGTGGHVGFASGPPPGRQHWLPERVLQFLADAMGATHAAPGVPSPPLTMPLPR